MRVDAEARFKSIALSHPLNAELLRRLPAIGLPDCWLVAGCLFQTVWNAIAGRPLADGIKDYDIFYFDEDLSWDAEDRAIARMRGALADLNIAVDLKNQARVHLWYEQRFGKPYPQLHSARDGIDRFLVAETCIGLSTGQAGNDVRLHAPFGVDDKFDGILRPNPLCVDPAGFAAKAASYRQRWPHLVIASALPSKQSTP